MVESAAVTAIIVNIIISIGLPLAFLGYMLYKRRRPLIPFVVGLLVFIVFQVVIRGVFQGFVASGEWYQNMVQNKWLYGLFAGVTMGLFTEGGRYIGYRLMLKDKTRFFDGVSAGAGYGGTEAILIGGLTYINMFSLANMVNSGQTVQISNLVGADAVNQVISNLTAVTPFDLYLGGVDRIFLFIIQIALSILVMLSIRDDKLYLLGIAFAAHLVIDGLPEAVEFSTVVMTVFLAVLAAIAVFFILKSKKLFGPEPEEK